MYMSARIDFRIAVTIFSAGAVGIALLFLFFSTRAPVDDTVLTDLPHIRITQDGFAPETLRVSRGTSVRFINETDQWRWPASDLHPTHTLYPEFDPRRGLAPGEEWQFRFERAGEWGFHDHLAPYVTGKIFVSDPQTQSSEARGIFTRLFSFLSSAKAGPRLSAARLVAEESAEFLRFDDHKQLETLRALGRSEGPQAVLSFLKKSYPDEPSDKHELSHIVGEAAFETSGFNGFGACDSFLRFGCYHGVILEAIRKNGYSEKVMRNLAEGCVGLPRNKTVITACAHGVGHGIMWVHSYGLLASYEECERIFEDQDNRFFCYDGVSMENVVRRDTRSGLTNDLESSDPYYPCNRVPVKYQSACTREHVFHARRTFFGKDTLKTAGYCLYFREEETRKECFGGLGNALNQDFFDSPQMVIDECGEVEERYRHFCFSVAASQYAFGGRIDNARMLCGAIGDEQKKADCRRAAAAAAASLF